MRPWAFHVVCMGSLWVLQLLPRVVNMHLGTGKFAALNLPKEAGIGSSIWYIHGHTFSLYLSHTSAFASLWLLRQFPHNAGHSSDTVLPGGTCIMGSSPSLRLSYFGGETQRKVVTVCFRHQSCLLLFEREAAIMRRATVYKALFYNDLCQQLLGGLSVM